MCYNLIKENIWFNLLFGEDNILLEDGRYLSEGVKLLGRDNFYIVDSFMCSAWYPVRGAFYCKKLLRITHPEYAVINICRNLYVRGSVSFWVELGMDLERDVPIMR